MKLTMRSAVLTLSLLAVIAGCGKKNNPAPGLEGLTGSYTITAMSLRTGSGTPVSVIADSLAACEQDNIYILNEDHTLNYIDAGTECDDSDGWDDVWVTEGNETRINLGGSDYIIKSFNGSVLVLEQEDGEKTLQTVLTKSRG